MGANGFEGGDAYEPFQAATIPQTFEEEDDMDEEEKERVAKAQEDQANRQRDLFLR